MDLSTKADVLRFCELRRKEMVGCFERLGRFESPNGYSFMGYCFATHEAKGIFERKLRTGPKLPAVEAVPLQIPRALMDVVPARQQTELFSRTVREFTRATKALGTLTMVEAWVAHAESKGRPWEEARKELPDSLADYEGRKEALIMWLEHSATGRMVWIADIDREPTRVLDWREQKWGDAEGRLIDLAGWQS